MVSPRPRRPAEQVPDASKEGLSPMPAPDPPADASLVSAEEDSVKRPAPDPPADASLVSAEEDSVKSEVYLADRTVKVDEKKGGTVKGDTGQKEVKKLTEPLKKINYYLMKRSLEWDGFVNSTEEIVFDDIAKSMSETENTAQQVIEWVKKLSKLAKKIETRLKEHTSRADFLKQLEESIAKCEISPALTLQQKADLDKAKCLLEDKVPKQKEMKNFEDPILLCHEMDTLRKRLEELSDPPVDKFSSVTKEDILFNPVTDILTPFIDRFRSRLIDHPQSGRILNSFLLPYQTKAGNQPPKWFRIIMSGYGDDEVVNYVRSDNVYYTAFKNRFGVFQLAPAGVPENARLIPNATFISCGGDYPSLMNYQKLEQGIGLELTKERLLELLLVKENFIQDVGVLSNYYHPPPPNYDIERFQQALARFCIICEILRNSAILEHVSFGWETGVRLTVLFLNYMWSWEPMSQALRTWLTDHTRVLTSSLQEKIVMNSPEEISGVLYLLINAQGPGIVVKAASGRRDDTKESDQYDDKNGSDHDDDKNGRDHDDNKNSSDQDDCKNLFDQAFGTCLDRGVAVSAVLNKLLSNRLALQGLLLPGLDHGVAESAGSSQLLSYPLAVQGWIQRVGKAVSSQPAVGSLMRGQPLVEVFGVAANFPFVGNISVFDNRWGMTICQCDDWNKSSSDFEARRRLWVQDGNAATEFKDYLVLTGPSRVLTASGGFVIKADVPRRGRKAREITQFEWNCSDSPIYNEPQICTITTRRGILFVTYAVLNDALEGFLCVRLRLSNELLLGEGPRVYGTIVAQVDKHENKSVLFCKGIEEAVQLSFRDGSFILPLSRSIVSVPFGANLHITGKLEFVGRGISTGIDHFIKAEEEEVHTEWVEHGHFIKAEEEEVHTEWVEHGTWSSAVQLWLSPRL